MKNKTDLVKLLGLDVLDMSLELIEPALLRGLPRIKAEIEDDGFYTAYETSLGWL